MPLAHLHRIDPEANMARFYCIDVAATLFGDVSVLRTWGRIGTHGRTSIKTCATVEDAERAASRHSVRKCGGAICQPAKCYRQTLRCEICQAFR
jgi:predicted DNA-binding WGR domain protein